MSDGDSALQLEARHRQRKPAAKRRKVENDSHEGDSRNRSDSLPEHQSPVSQPRPKGPELRQPPMNNDEIGGWVATLLNGKDTRIGELEKLAGDWSEEYFECAEKLLYIRDEISRLQRHIETESTVNKGAKLPEYPEPKLEALWNKLKFTVNSVLDGADAEISALEDQLNLLKAHLNC